MSSIQIMEEEDGRRHVLIEPVNHSLAKTFKRCPRQAMYKYVEGFIPRVDSKPLTRGKWFHALLEEDYRGGEWKVVHREWTRKFEELFDEEKEHLGDLPREMFRLMLSYKWHYANESEWEVLEVEKTIAATLPNGREFKCRVDMLVRDIHGLWLVDHKTHRTLPDLSDRLLDTQSPLYIWACWENGIDVNGFIWNYVCTKAPSVPRVVKAGNRFYKKLGPTDYYTYARALKRSGFPVEAYRDTLNMLKAQRYKFGAPQTSEFFQRHIVERNEFSVGQALREFMTTQERFEDYNFDPLVAERTPDRMGCKNMCSYRDLCTAELHGYRTKHIMRNYRVGDPFEYYEEGKEREI